MISIISLYTSSGFSLLIIFNRSSFLNHVICFLPSLFVFILDFIEICYVFVPLIAPPLLMMGFDPVWLGIMLAINLQTSFLTPPFGFSLFYLRGVADKSIRTIEIYKGVIPFIAIQLLVLLMVILFPSLVL